MPAARMDKLMWIFIFGGMIAAGIGLAVTRSDDGLGGLFIAVGVLLVAVGVTMIWLRSLSRSRSRSRSRDGR